MDFSFSRDLPANTDTIIRFILSGSSITFEQPDVREAYETLFSEDCRTLGAGEMISLRLPLGDSFVTVLLVAVDLPCDMEGWRSTVRKTGTALNTCGGRTVFVDRLPPVPGLTEGALLGQLASLLPLCEYRFQVHKTQVDPVTAHNMTLFCGPEAMDPVHEGALLARCVSLARDLVNEDASVLTPEALAECCQLLGSAFGFRTEILEEAECRELGMGLFLGVARGSELPPRFIIMRHSGGQEGERPLALVGKGITYDTGGLQIKTSGMDRMRFDMNGAAAVIGAMCALAARNVKCNVVAVVAACENAVDARSLRNGEVLTSMNGKTVYVQNTDAEGRLTMADAITWCVRTCSPREIIEIAGLTGSVCRFYGSICAGALTTSPALFERLRAVMEVTGEKYAQMPAFPEYEKLLACPYADLTNDPQGDAGGILAGLFLRTFSETVPFLHLDLGATPFVSAPSEGQPAGATGFGVRTLYEYVKKSLEGPVE